jgi:diketogulonate reductase-like aldo/keto reductase
VPHDSLAERAAQDGEPVLLVACSLPDQFGVLADRCQRHAGGAELDAQFQPLQVRFAIGAAAVGRPLHRAASRPSRSQKRSACTLSPVRSAAQVMASRAWRPGYGLDLESALGSSVRSMPMHYRALGGTGIQVSAYCLGTMMFGADGNPDHDDCIRIIHAALDQGINFVDTADMYGGPGGETEEIVGKALKGRRDEVVLATKVHFQMGEGRNRSGNSRRWILVEAEESLRRLQTDWIDLYQIHRPDPATDIEETLSVLTDLVHAGKIRAFGCSAFPAEDIVGAYHVAERRGLMRFRTEQPPYSLLARGIEASVLPACQRLGMEC